MTDTPDFSTTPVPGFGRQGLGTGTWGPLFHALSAEPVGADQRGFGVRSDSAVFVYHRAVPYVLRYRIASHVIRIDLGFSHLRAALNSDRLIDTRLRPFWISFIPAGAERIVEVVTPGPAILINITAREASLLAQEAGTVVPDHLVELPFDARRAPHAATCWSAGVVRPPLNDLELDVIAIELFQAVLDAARSRPPVAAALTPARLRRVQALLLDADPAILTLGDLAAAAGMGRSGFIRAYSARLGISPHQHILRSRLDKALTLLRVGQHDLSRIALSSGFSSQSHLTTTMRNITGLTPAAWRLKLCADRCPTGPDRANSA
jgi:AraC family transcriptional regulator